MYLFMSILEDDLSHGTACVSWLIKALQKPCMSFLLTENGFTSKSGVGVRIVSKLKASSGKRKDLHDSQAG